MRITITLAMALFCGALLLDSVGEAQVKQPQKQPQKAPKLPKTKNKGGFGILPPDVQAQFENQAKQNADVMVADAVRLVAVAELNREKQRVGVKLASIYAELETAKGVLTLAEKRVTTLRGSKDATADLTAAQEQVTKAKAVVSMWQGELTAAMGDKSSAIVVVTSGYKDALDRAFKKNEDVLAAQAKVNQAEEEVSRVRKEVAAKIAANKAARDNADMVLKDAQAKLTKMQQQFSAGSATQSQVDSAAAAVTASKSEANRLQIELTYLTGGSVVLIDNIKSSLTPQTSGSLFGK